MIKYLIALLVFAASVLASDLKSNFDIKKISSAGIHVVGTTTLPEHDTVYEYMTVDTVLTCPNGWELYWETITVSHPDPDMAAMWNEAVKRCRYRNQDCEWEYCIPDTIIHTTWLPKVQVWMDSTEYKEYIECLLFQ